MKKYNLPLSKFFEGAMKRASSQPNERIGQAFFNYLTYVKPELAEKIRGTEFDPFYLTDLKTESWTKFIDYLEKNWDS